MNLRRNDFVFLLIPPFPKIRSGKNVSEVSARMLRKHFPNSHTLKSKCAKTADRADNVTNTAKAGNAV